MRSLAYIFQILLLVILISSCQPRKEQSDQEMMTFTDDHGREVTFPVKPARIIAHGPGALRLITYLNATDKIIAIEESERRRNAAYVLANIEIRELPVIGSGNNADPELVHAQEADLIISCYKIKAEVDKLQLKSATPVIFLDYGDFDEERDVLFNSLKKLGMILDRKERATELINFIKSEIRSFAKIQSDNSFYIGGIAYRGAHGIESTSPSYLPFKLLGLKNAADPILKNQAGLVSVLETISIDKEQIIEWNPDRIFIDLAGYKRSKQDLRLQSEVGYLLDAIQENEVYTLLPHIWNTVNYEHILINTAYLHESLQGSATNISISRIANKYYQAFYGKDLYNVMVDLYGLGIQKLNIDE